MASPKKKSEVRLNKAGLFAGLGYTPHAGQLEVHRSKAKRRILACGTRWGKSTLAAYECIGFLLEPRDKALGWLIAPTYELTRRVFERVVAILSDRMKHRVKSYDRRAHSIVVSNLAGGTSELRARSADRPAGLLGDALDFLVVDEAVKIREDVWGGYIAPRLIDRHGSALILSTPSTTKSWFFREFKRAKKDPEYAAFCMPTISNPHVPSDLVEAERGRLAPEVFASQYEARFTGLDFEKCDTCGGPDVHARAGVTLHGAERLHFCPDCGLMVHADGSTAVGIEGWSGEDRLSSGVTVFADESTDLDMVFPDYCRHNLFLCPSHTHPEQLPDGIE